MQPQPAERPSQAGQKVRLRNESFEFQQTSKSLMQAGSETPLQGLPQHSATSSPGPAGGGSVPVSVRCLHAKLSTVEKLGMCGHRSSESSMNCRFSGTSTRVHK